MPISFDMDVSPLVEHGLALIERHGPAMGARIFNCERPHTPGIRCICGWNDDPPMPDPLVVESGA